MITTPMVPQDRDVHDASSVINEVCASLYIGVARLALVYNSHSQ